MHYLYIQKSNKPVFSWGEGVTHVFYMYFCVIKENLPGRHEERDLVLWRWKPISWVCWSFHRGEKEGFVFWGWGRVSQRTWRWPSSHSERCWVWEFPVVTMHDGDGPHLNTALGKLEPGLGWWRRMVADRFVNQRLCQGDHWCRDDKWLDSRKF